jgi:hypothetical protein
MLAAKLYIPKGAPNALREHCKPVDDALLQYLSEHINLTGDYLWRSCTNVGSGKLMTLRPFVSP